MTKLLLCSLALIITSAIAGCSTTSRSEVQEDAIFVIEGRQADSTRTWGGSGFLCDDQQTLVTAWHVMERLSSPWVNLGTRGRVTIESVVSSDEVEDVIVLRLATPVHDTVPLQLRAGFLARGEVVQAMHHLEKGKLDRVNMTLQDEGDTAEPMRLTFAGSLEPGASGCPCFGSNGQVVGMAVGTRAGPDIVVSVPACIIRPLLRSIGGEPPIPFEDWRHEVLGGKAQEYLPHLDSGNYYVRTQEWTSALKCFGLALRTKNDRFAPLHRAMQCMQELGWDADQMSEWYKAEGIDTKRSWYCSMELGHVFRKRSELDKAEPLYRRAAELRPCAVTRYWMAYLYFRTKRHKESLDILAESVRLWPEHLQTLVLLGEVARALDAPDLEIAADTQISQTHPTMLRSLVEAGQIQHQQHDSEGFARTLARLKALSPIWANRLEFLAQTETTHP